VSYTNPQGHRFLRVISQECQTTRDKKLVEKEARVKVVHTRIAQKSTDLMKYGSEEEAVAYNKHWANYMETALNTNEEAAIDNTDFLRKNDQLAKAYKHKNLKKKLQ
jgi:hypothetical protein